MINTEITLDDIKHLENNCPAFMEFYGELHGAANRGLLLHSIRDVTTGYNANGECNITLHGVITFQPSLDELCLTPQDYMNLKGKRLLAVFEHLVEKYGTFLKSITGCDCSASDKFAHISFDYRWEYKL